MAMKILMTGAMALVISLAAFVMAGTTATGQEPGVQSLRGQKGIPEAGAAPDIKRPMTGRRLPRAYRQQPPLIPHKTQKYQINLKVNQCLRCHDWPHNVEEGAPKISETHYVDRNGVALDKVTRSRWFCTQCHVGQVQARALVPNTFRSSNETD
jgi:cytochrome c-type protein NapB